MRIYLAAPYAARDAVRERAAELTRIGFQVTSTWLDEQHDINDGTVGAATDLSDAAVRRHCETDFLDIDRAEVLVMLVPKTGADGWRSTSGGRHVETGYALAQGKEVFVVGPPENVFHRGVCTLVPDWHTLVLALVELRESQTLPVTVTTNLCPGCAS